jgi:hypothetical protein
MGNSLVNRLLMGASEKEVRAVLDCARSSPGLSCSDSRLLIGVVPVEQSAGRALPKR